MNLNFIKMSAIGNDFIVVDGFKYDINEIIPHASNLCDRHFGIGADGIIFHLPCEAALASSSS